MSPSKERTVAYPHRMMNKASLYLIKQTLQNDGSYLGANQIDATTTLTLTTNNAIDAFDGRVFDYVLSRIQALGLKNAQLTFYTEDLLEELSTQKRTENRNKIVQSLNNLVDVTITLSFQSGAITLTLLDSLTQVDGNKEVSVTLSQSFIDAMDEGVAKTRYVNIARTMKAKSAYSIELAKLLQMDGQGVNKQGQPKPVKQIKHVRLCHYLNLDAVTPSSHTTLRKAFNELHALGYPAYKYNGNKQEWQLQN